MVFDLTFFIGIAILLVFGLMVWCMNTFVPEVSVHGSRFTGGHNFIYMPWQGSWQNVSLAIIDFLKKLDSKNRKYRFYAIYYDDTSKLVDQSKLRVVIGVTYNDGKIP